MNNSENQLWRAANQAWQSRQQVWFSWLDAHGNNIYTPESQWLSQRMHYAGDLACEGYKQIEAQFAEQNGVKAHQPSGEYFLSNEQKLEIESILTALQHGAAPDWLQLRLWALVPRFRRLRFQRRVRYCVSRQGF